MKIAVVGGGIAGLISAYTLARAGHDVTVFEKGRVGGGASGLSLGVLVPISLDRPIDRLQRAGIEAWPELAREVVRLSGSQDLRLEDVFRDWGDGSYQVRVPEVFAVLKEAIERLGGFVREGCGEVGLRDLPGFEAVILAAGLGNAAFGQALKVSAGQALRLKTPAPLRRLVAADKLFVAPDWDGSVLVGSENWPEAAPGDGRPRDEVTADLLRRAVAAAPEIAGAEVVQAWVGYRPVSEPRLPLVRPMPAPAFTGADPEAHVWAVAGLGKVGLGLAPCVASYLLKSIS